jgi:UPF0176 protein
MIRMTHTILLFYKYVPIEDTEALRDEQRKLAEGLGLLGRLIIAPEGINGTFEGTHEAIQTYIETMRTDARFADSDFKTSEGTGIAFPKLSIKVRKEIVASGLGEEVNPNVETGKHLEPDELHSWYEEGREFQVVDMRNDYEFVSGHFKNAIEPGMRYFRDLNQKVETLEHLKDVPVVTVCTGGVRCEKASAFLKKKGFTKVYQLKGGIHRYVEKYPGEHFRGGLYVFDGRVVMDTAPEDKKEIVGTCAFCATPTEEYADDDTVMPSRQVLCCKACLGSQSHLRPARQTY